MQNYITLPMDIVSPTLKNINALAMKAHGGYYLHLQDNSWVFKPSAMTKLKLLTRGIKAPDTISADKLRCWRGTPSYPTLGGFIHPELGFWCQAAAIPDDWNDTRFNVTAGMADVDASTLRSAAIYKAAQELNKSLGIGTAMEPKWWLYTLPKVNGIELGVKSNIYIDRELPNRFMDIPINILQIQPKQEVLSVSGSGYSMSDIGAAPVMTVMPTDSPNYREPNFYGMGEAPVTYVPVGTLNFDRRTGYEGQPWVVKDPPTWAWGLGDVGSSESAGPETPAGSVLLALALGSLAALALKAMFATKPVATARSNPNSKGGKYYKQSGRGKKPYATGTLTRKMERSKTLKGMMKGMIKHVGKNEFGVNLSPNAISKMIGKSPKSLGRSTADGVKLSLIKSRADGIFYPKARKLIALPGTKTVKVERFKGKKRR